MRRKNEDRQSVPLLLILPAVTMSAEPIDGKDVARPQGPAR